jgi:hypothetical protein
MNMNPYAMQTYSMPANMNAPPMMGPMTHSSVNAMQNMYGNLQQQQQVAQQLMPNAVPTTMQNVSVVDFKPDTMAQHHIAQMQRHYQNQINSRPAAVAPSLGLMSADGRYTPATAATPYAPSFYNTAGAFDSTRGFDHETDGRFSDGMDYLGKHTRRAADYTSMKAREASASAHERSVRGREYARMKYKQMFGNGTASDFAGLDPMHRRSFDVDSEASSPMNNRMSSSAFSRSNIDSRAMSSPSPQSIAAMIKAGVDAGIKANVDSMKLASAMETTTSAATSLATKQSISAMVDEHLVAKAAELDAKAAMDLKESVLSEQRVQALVNASTIATAAAAVSPNVGSGVTARPLHEQKELIGAAVRSVMKDFHVLPKSKVGSGMQQPGSRPFTTASSFNDYSRY